MKNKMNKDYSYCVGYRYFDLSGPLNLSKLCKNCRRRISYDKFTKVERWTYIQYDRKTGKCPMFDKKFKFFNKILSIVCKIGKINS